MKYLILLIIFFFSKTYGNDAIKGLEFYQNGNYKKAIEIWLPLAKEGDTEAQLGMGMAYHQGNGVSENFKAATTWYLKAARQGSPKGQHNMGVMYMHGLGIEQNYKKSAYWYKLAALNGVDESQHNLASYYSLGRGVNLDYFKSYMWAHVADLNGYKLSKTIKMLLITKLKRKDRKQAKSRAEECFNSRYSRC